MTKKKKIDNSDPSINLRLPKRLKDELTEKAYLKNQTVSTYVRTLIENYISGELYKDEIAFYKRHHFITSLEFIQLLLWIYEKRQSNEYLESDKNKIPSLIRTLKAVDNYLPKELSIEFDKILFDIFRSQKEDLQSFRNFQFFEGLHEVPIFDLKMLEDYIKNIEIPGSKYL